jgi:predicted ferric reductase
MALPSAPPTAAAPSWPPPEPAVPPATRPAGAGFGVRATQAGFGVRATQAGGARLRPADLVFALVLNLGIVTAMWIRHGGIDDLGAPGGVLTAAGRLAGLYGVLAVLVELLLMARVPLVERSIGSDRLMATHRWVGFATVWLLVGHAVLITLGYAASLDQPVTTQVGDLVLTYPDVLMATVGLALFLLVAFTSVRAARRRLAYETWHFIHFYTYLAIALSFAHQFAVGTDFVDDVVARAYWGVLYGAIIGALVVCRFGRPVALWLRHRPVVTAVVPEGPGVVSLHVGGRRFDRLGAEAGQFFKVRFLTPSWWFRSHPFSLSAAPDGRRLRFTVKDLGDHTRSLQALPPGTRISLEGPFGIVTPSARQRDRVLLIAGGVGITPLRAILETLPPGRGRTILIYRVPSWADAVFFHELEHLAARDGVVIHYLVGRRGVELPPDPLAADQLARLVPDVAQRDVYLCGPPAMTTGLVRDLQRLGVPRSAIHTEQFAY